MIEVHGLDKSYGSKQVLSNVSFTAENGIVTGFVGPNGAGKSTTMRMIAQLEIPDSGQALIDGQPFSQASHPLQTMGVYLGSDYLPGNETGQAYLEYVCRVGGVSRDIIPSLLESVELTGAENKKISSYSLGMKQRIGLAAAIAGNANTLMLDEPVNGLDPMGVQWLRNLLRSQAQQGKAVLLSSHLLSELEVVADKIVMIEHGKIIAQGMLNDLVQNNNKREKQVIVHTSDDVGIARFLSQNRVRVSREDGYLRIWGATPQYLARFIVMNKVELYRLEEKRETLEEMFMARAAAGNSSQLPPSANLPAPAGSQMPVQHQMPAPRQIPPAQQGYSPQTRPPRPAGAPAPQYPAAPAGYPSHPQHNVPRQFPEGGRYVR